jgi:hypothetical protein
MRADVKVILALLLVVGAVGQALANVAAALPAGDESRQERPVFAVVPQLGRRVQLDAERYFVFTFDKEPTMGTVIAKVEIYTAGDRKDTSFEIKGNADMPGMGCQKGKPDRLFMINKKGSYLLPYTFGMPGDWEVYLTFLKDGAVVYRGKYAFTI